MLQPIIPTFDTLPGQILHSLSVYIQSLTSALGNRFFGSVVRALDFIRADRVRIPRQMEFVFSYASILCYHFHVVRYEYLNSTYSAFVRPIIECSHVDVSWDDCVKYGQQKKKQKKKQQRIISLDATQTKFRNQL